MSNDANVRAWVKAQEALLWMEREAEVIRRFMERNATAAENPVRQIQLEGISKRLVQARAEIEEIEKLIGKDPLNEIRAELEAIRRGS
jgi:hypothetical protein